MRSDLGYSQVLTAPPQVADDRRLPVVTVGLRSETPPGRVVGEDMTGDDFQSIGGFWRESEGWLSEVTLDITGWSLNPDERIELRRALRRIIVGNLPVFDNAGMVQIGLTVQDRDFLKGEFGAPLYACVNSFTCMAPVIVRSQEIGRAPV